MHLRMNNTQNVLPVLKKNPFFIKKFLVPSETSDKNKN